MTEQSVILERFEVKDRKKIPHLGSATLPILGRAYSGASLKPTQKTFPFKLPDDDIVLFCHDTITNSRVTLAQRVYRGTPAADVVRLGANEFLDGYLVIIPPLIPDKDWRLQLYVAIAHDGNFQEARLIFDYLREFERARHESVTIGPEEFGDWENLGQANLRQRLETIFRPSLYQNYLDKAIPDIRKDIEELSEIANKYIP